MSANLNLPQMAENQASPEITHNDALAQLDAALTETFSADVSAGNVTVTSGQYQAAVRILATGAGTPRDVTLPAVARTIILENDGAATDDVSFKRGSTTITLSPGERVFAITDGTTNGLASITVAVGALPLGINMWIRSKPVASDKILRINVRRGFSLPTNLAGSSVDAVTAATASTTFTFKKNGSSIGTAVFSAAGTVAALTLTATSFDVDDIFTIETPAQDATLAGVAFNLVGTWNG